MNAGAVMRMSLLDRAFYLLDEARSPQDFALILHLNDSPNLDHFYAGARSAMNRFPISASCVQGRNWVWRENKYFKLDIIPSSTESENRSALQRFVNKPFDLRCETPIKQALVMDGRGRVRVATRFHHSAADGLSAALWLGHQLNVAYGLEAAQHERTPFVDLPLRRPATSVRRSQFAFDKASDPLRTASAKRSGRRSWTTISFPAADLQKACRRVGGFTYNDLLATITLEAMRLSDHDRIGLWVPMNVRREHNAGFGNGTSRIRVYARFKPGSSLIDKCREVRRQVSWTSKHGEWAVPDVPWFTSLPGTVIGPLLRGYLRLPSVDMATGVFSHAGSWLANAGEAFKHVERIESVGLLHPRQYLATNAATHNGTTWLTFTYDPAQLGTEEIENLRQRYEGQIALAREALL
jgi:hypothetical protein